MSKELNAVVRHALDNADDPEREALALLHYLQGRFGWMGTVMTRADAEHVLGRPLTDEEWVDVTAQPGWRKAPAVWHELGVTWDAVSEALESAGLLD